MKSLPRNPVIRGVGSLSVAIAAPDGPRDSSFSGMLFGLRTPDLGWGGAGEADGQWPVVSGLIVHSPLSMVHGPVSRPREIDLLDGVIAKLHRRFPCCLAINPRFERVTAGG